MPTHNHHPNLYRPIQNLFRNFFNCYFYKSWFIILYLKTVFFFLKSYFHHSIILKFILGDVILLIQKYFFVILLWRFNFVVPLATHHIEAEHVNPKQGPNGS